MSAIYQTPLLREDFEARFAPLKPLTDPALAGFESTRCLYCHDAPCVKACPTGIDIPLFIRQIAAKNPIGAAKTIYSANWLGHACGQVCPTEELCEGACVFTYQGQPAIDIGRLQSFATYKAIDDGVSLFSPGPDNGRRVAVIGAGPAGVAAACELRSQGFSVDILEASPKPGGLNVSGVALYKFTETAALRELEWLRRQFQFGLTLNSPVETQDQLTGLDATYDAVFLAIGMGDSRRLRVPGHDLPGNSGAVEFIERLREQKHTMPVPGRVVVIGGGNTAMDASIQAALMGATEVTLVYRGDQESISAYAAELDLARRSGVRILFRHSVVNILGKDRVEFIRLAQTHRSGGQWVANPEHTSELAADCVLWATGQSPRDTLLNLISGLKRDASGRVLVNASGQTSNPRYFAAGDVVNGGKEVVHAVADARKVAQEIGRWLLTPALSAV